MNRKYAVRGNVVELYGQRCKITKVVGNTCEVKPLDIENGGTLVGAIRKLVLLDDPKKAKIKVTKSKVKKTTLKKVIEESKKNPRRKKTKVEVKKVKEESKKIKIDFFERTSKAYLAVIAQNKLPEKILMAKLDRDLPMKMEAINKVMRMLKQEERVSFLGLMLDRKEVEYQMYLLLQFVENNKRAFSKLDFKTEIEDYSMKHEKISKKPFKFEQMKLLNAYIQDFNKSDLFEYKHYDKWIKEFIGCQDVDLVFEILCGKLNKNYNVVKLVVEKEEAS